MEASRAARQPRTRKSLRKLAPLRLKRGADPAFEQLYRNHAREVYQYALALTANSADAEDVTQTTFLNAYRAFQRGERPHKPHNWLITITHNVCRMRWRQAGSRPSEVALDEAPEPAAFDHERPDLGEVLTALAGLTFNQRAAIVMRELEGRSYQEIAGVLGLSVGAVEALLFRARRSLQVNRKALGVLGTVPLPGSLTSFLGAGGGSVAAGGMAIGADLVLKVAAVVAVGAVTTGVGYKSVEALRAHSVPAAAMKAGPAPAGKQLAAVGKAPSRADVSASRKKLRRAAASTRPDRFVRPTTVGQASLPTGGAGASAPPAAPAVQLAPPQVASGVLPAPVPPAPLPPVAVPPAPVPVLPVVPLPPVHVTPPPVPPLPPIPVTIPPLPPPPIK